MSMEVIPGEDWNKGYLHGELMLRDANDVTVPGAGCCGGSGQCGFKKARARCIDCNLEACA